MAKQATQAPAPDPREKIIDLLLNKSALKQDIADYSESVLAEFKEVVQEELDELRKFVNDKRVRLSFHDRGKYEFRVSVGSDVLVFQLHTNVFRFEDENPIWKTKYLKKNGANGFFGIINVYNFLAESMEQSRYNDLGYLIGRIFLNHEGRFIVEGQGQLGFLFRDLEKEELNRDTMRRIIQVAMTYAIEFDLITPPFTTIQEVSIAQIEEISSDLKVATGKRLGFRFSAEDKDVF